MNLCLNVLAVNNLLNCLLFFDVDPALLNNFLHKVGNNIVIHLHSDILMDNSRLLGICCLDLLVENQAPEIDIGMLDWYVGILFVGRLPDLLRAEVLDIGEEVLVVELYFLNLEVVRGELWEAMLFRHETLELELGLIFLIWVTFLVVGLKEFKIVHHFGLLGEDCSHHIHHQPLVVSSASLRKEMLENQLSNMIISVSSLKAPVQD